VNHWKAYATVAVVGALMIPATAAHAEIAWYTPDVGFDCEAETMVIVNVNGTLSHYPAMAYEIETFCGVPATIVWTDEQQNGEPLYVETLNDPAPVVAPAPVPAVQTPAPVAVAVAPVTVDVEPRWGHYLFKFAV
jgi:hypothetical protein